MPLQIHCPACRQIAVVPNSAGGKSARCSCGQIISIPIIVSDSQPEPSDELSLQPNAPISDQQTASKARSIREQRELEEAKLAGAKAAALNVITYFPTKVSRWFKRKTSTQNTQSPVDKAMSDLKFCPKCAEPWRPDARYCAKCAWDSTPQQPGISPATLNPTSARSSSSFIGTAIEVVFVIIGSAAKIIAVLILVTAIGMFIFLLQKNPAQNMRQATNANTPISSASPEAVLSIDADQLMAEYKANEVAADEKFKGKVLLISGTVKNIGKDIVDSMYVSLKTRELISSVQCMFPDVSKSALAALEKGQHVQIQGECTGKLGNVVIRNCSLR